MSFAKCGCIKNGSEILSLCWSGHHLCTPLSLWLHCSYFVAAPPHVAHPKHCSRESAREQQREQASHMGEIGQTAVSLESPVRELQLPGEGAAADDALRRVGDA